MIERFAGRYALLQHLGRGGMGDVYLARDLTTGAECALKRLRLAQGREIAGMLEAEFRVLAGVRHPAVVRVFELGFAADGQPFFTMEYVPGVRADRALARGDHAALGFALVQLALGLEALHDAGVVHGDLKPSNVLVVPGPRPGALPEGIRLLDFGFARFERDASPGRRGTPGFAAPEVARGDAPTPASDLYGFGATLFALASGREPFEGGSVSAVLRRQQSGPPSAAALEDTVLPPAFRQLVLRLLSTAPAERGEGIREARRELERIFPAARRPLADRLRVGRPVGRERELARLEGWLADPASRVRLQILLGPSGTGTSALLEELAARAAVKPRGILRLSGTMPAGAAARALVRRLIGEAESSSHPWPQELSAWLASEDTPPREEDLALLAGATLDGLARDAGASRPGGAPAEVPLVLVDDSDSLDPVTRALLRRLLLAPQGAVRSVWTRRGTRGALGGDERALIAAGLADVIEIGPLEHASLARLASSRLGAPAPERLVEWLWARAAGHPGFTVELLRHAANAGAVVDDDSGLGFSESVLETLTAPPDFEASVIERWKALPQDAQRAAAALAAWGRAALPADLRAVEPAADGTAIDLLLLEGLATRDSSGALAFSPPGLGPRVLSEIEPEARRRLHDALVELGHLDHAERFEHLRAAGRADEALVAAEAAFAAGADDHLAAAVAVLIEPSAPIDAARWFERAGEALFDRGRHPASVLMLERSIALDPDGEGRHRRRARLAHALFRAGRIASLERLTDEALADDPPRADRAQLMMAAANLHVARGRYEEAAKGFRASLELFEAAGDDAETAVVALSLANALLRLGRTEEAAESAVRATTLFRSAGRQRGVLRSLGLRASIARHAGDYAGAESRYAETVTTARATQERFVLVELLIARGTMWVELGRWRAARDDFKEALQLALEDGRAGEAATAMSNRALLEGLTGSSRSALRDARSALRMARSAYPSMHPAALRALAQAHRIAGRLSRAEGLARRALSMAGAPAEERDWSRLEVARALLASGRLEDIRTLTADTEDHAPVRTAGRAALRLLAGRAALRLGDAATAERSLASAEAWRDGRPLAYLEALARQLGAELALTRGRASDAVALARETLERFAALPAAPDRAMAALDLARLAAAEAPDTRLPVESWLEEAAAAFQRLGDLPARERSLALLVRRLKLRGPAGERSASAPDLIAAVRRLLDSLSDLRELAQRAMRLVVEQLDAERGVLLLDDGSGEFVEMAVYGAVDASVRRNAVGYSRRIVERVARSGGVVLLGDAVSDPMTLSESIVDMQLHSIVCVPMFVAGRVIGAVYLDDARRSDAFSDQDRALLEGFAQLMAVAFETSRGRQEVERTNRQLVGENIQLRQQAGVRFQTQNLVAKSSEMQRVLAVVESVAHSDATVLLTGENGTGKELIAQTLHHAGRRHGRPFVPVNCGAIPETLLESELFGILPRVATGVGAREGRFVQANGGTLFLDEIGDMPLQQQVALLRVLASHEVTPVGGGPAIPIDVRIIAATNRDIGRLVETGAFREDLFHRLNVIPIEVPPLRDRKADIPALAHHFVQRFAAQQERAVPTLPPELLAVLMQSDWPGNVRALQNYIERIMAMNPGAVLYPRPLPRDLEAPSAMRLSRGRTLAAMVEEMEQRMIHEALNRSGGNQTAAAKELGLTEQSLRYRLRKYSLSMTRRKRRPR
ncbi:MAG TPA: sigma 54-interacting transcriptional regulator [Candidatus Udaeobacter sp.]|nr:sigma 54-interacting transcriptional regulator [Candidatus Udaeobacter sp.]